MKILLFGISLGMFIRVIFEPLYIWFSDLAIKEHNKEITHEQIQKKFNVASVVITIISIIGIAISN